MELELCCLHVWRCLSDQVLIIRISQQTSSWPNPISKLMPFRFWSFGWDSFWFVWMIFICLGFDGFWLCFGQQRMVHKTWDDGKEQNCCQDYKTIPLLTTSKSVIIKDPHRAKKKLVYQSLEIILDSDRKTEDTDQCKCFQTKLDICMWWQTFEKVFQTASSPSLVTIRIEYITGNAKINQLDLYFSFRYG